MGERYSYRLRIDTYTPVSIGNGSFLSPITDFFVSQRTLYILDKTRLNRVLIERNKIDLFTEQVTESVNESKTGTNFSVYSFIKRELGLEPEQLTIKNIPFPNASQSKEQIAGCFTSNGKPVIPGSTLKGAIKGALLFKWLTSTEGSDTLNAMIKDILRNKRPNTSFFSDDDPENKKLEAELSVGDSEPFSEKSLVVYRTDRLHYKRKNSRVPQTKMCIERKQASKFQYKSAQWPFNKALVDAINDFSYQSLSIEQDILNDSGNIGSYTSERLNSFYDDIKGEIRDIKASGALTCFLRIGSGKSYFDNSIGIAICLKNEDAFKKLREFYELGKAPKERNFSPKEPFPITRTIISELTLPLGWIKFSLAKN